MFFGEKTFVVVAVIVSGINLKPRRTFLIRFSSFSRKWLNAAKVSCKKKQKQKREACKE